MTRVAVMGTGSWGTAVSMILADSGGDVTLWGRRRDLVERLAATRRNPDYLPDLELPPAVRPTADPVAALDGAELVVLAIPTQMLRETLTTWEAWIPPQARVLSLAKGVELATLARPSEVVTQVAGVPPERLAVIAGPNLAGEIALRHPTATVVASTDPRTAHEVARCVATPYFRPVLSDDLIGCELGGATKNVVAVAVGMAVGLGLGDNTKATLMTRGLAETVRLGVALGARPETFHGLAGVGDLIATCMSPLSRNRRVGEALGQGRTIDDVAATTRQTAEGVTSCESILALAQAADIDIPLIEAVVAVVNDKMHPALLASALMARELKAEKG